MLSSKDVTEEMVKSLRSEAVKADDVRMVKHCDLADTNVDSFRVVLEALRAAERAKRHNVRRDP